MPAILDPDEHFPAVPPVTRRGFFLVTIGRISLVATWFAATMLMARVLRPRNFGIYALYTSIIALVTGCFGDPLDMAVMRQAPLYLNTDRPRALATIKSAFWIRTGLGVVSIIVAASLPWLVPGTGNDRNRIMLAALGILGDLLLRSVLGYFQAGEQFAAFMLIDCIWQLGRAAAVVVFVIFHMLRPETALLIYIALPYIGFIVATLILPADVMNLRPPPRHQVLDIFHYGKWMVIALMMAAIYERLDIFLLEWFHGSIAVGIYRAALVFAVIPDFIDGGIQTVLGPKVAPAFAAGTFPALQRAYLRYSVPTGILAAVLAMLLGGPVIRIFLSSDYATSVMPFRILVLSTLFNVIVTPLPAALLNYIAPKKVALITFMGLLLVIGGGFAIIPRYGVFGAAIVILIARLVIGTAIVLLVGKLTSPRPSTS